MDVHSGDILALASVPSFDPNYFVRRGDFPARLLRAHGELEAEKNRATFELYAPGSIFKTIVGLGRARSGPGPDQRGHVPPNPQDPGHGYYKLMLPGRNGEETRPSRAPTTSPAR